MSNLTPQPSSEVYHLHHILQQQQWKEFLDTFCRWPIHLADPIQVKHITQLVEEFERNRYYWDQYLLGWSNSERNAYANQFRSLGFHSLADLFAVSPSPTYQGTHFNNANSPGNNLPRHVSPSPMPRFHQPYSSSPSPSSLPHFSSSSPSSLSPSPSFSPISSSTSSAFQTVNVHQNSSPYSSPTKSPSPANTANDGSRSSPVDSVIITHRMRITSKREGIKTSDIEQLLDSNVNGWYNVLQHKPTVFFLNSSQEDTANRAYSVITSYGIHGFNLTVDKPEKNESKVQCNSHSIKYWQEMKSSFKSVGVVSEKDGDTIILRGVKHEKVKKQLEGIIAMPIYDVEENSVRDYLRKLFDQCVLIKDKKGNFFILGEQDSVNKIKKFRQTHFAMEKIGVPYLDKELQRTLAAKASSLSLSFDTARSCVFLRDLNSKDQVEKLIKNHRERKQNAERKLKLDKENYCFEKLEWIKKYNRRLLSEKYTSQNKSILEFKGNYKMAMKTKKRVEETMVNLMKEKIECPWFSIRNPRSDSYHLENEAEKFLIWHKIQKINDSKKLVTIVGPKGEGFDEMKTSLQERSNWKNQPVKLQKSQIKFLEKQKAQMEDSLNVYLDIKKDYSKIFIVGPQDNIDAALGDIKEVTQGKKFNREIVQVPPIFKSQIDAQRQKFNEKSGATILSLEKPGSFSIKGHAEKVEHCKQLIHSNLSNQSFSVQFIPIHQCLTAEQTNTLKNKIGKKNAMLFRPNQLSTYLKPSKNVRVYIIKNDIMDVPAEALVNPANSKLSNNSGLSKMISLWAGPHFQQQCDKTDNVPIGKASIMKGYLSTFNHIINAITWASDTKGGITDDMEGLIQDVFDIANREGIKSIALPMLGTGINNRNPEGVANMMAKVILNTVQKPDNQVEDIYISPREKLNIVEEEFIRVFTTSERLSIHSSPGNKIVVKRQWYWCEDNDEFIPYDTDQNVQIEMAFQNNQRQCQVVGDRNGRQNGFQYDVFFDGNDGLPKFKQQNTKTYKLRSLQFKELGSWVRLMSRDKRPHFYVNVDTLETRENRPNDWCDVKFNGESFNDIVVDQHGPVQSRGGTILHYHLEGIFHHNPHYHEQSITNTNATVPGVHTKHRLPVKAVIWDKKIISSLKESLAQLENKFIQKYQCKLPASCELELGELEKVFWKRKGNEVTVEGLKTNLEGAKQILQLKTAHHISMPEHWDENAKSLYLEVNLNSQEGRDVCEVFYKTCPQRKIIKIERVQNDKLWENFCKKKQTLESKNGRQESLYRLFHGTSGTDPKEICRSVETSFDMRYSSQGLWGRACYFAQDAAYSVPSYTYSTNIGGVKYQQIFLASVLLGHNYDQMSSRVFKTPPVRTTDFAGRNIHYDSVHGLTNGFDVYMVYENNRAYPEYLITFK
eukprot:gb/GECH01005313.1/.p1 GENE.gb/GECH01005313.1/~~gb/GECH01005313.1/.p1  ORF type:complete len:1398 (+),score=234.61 gb/GECH01005313.1/:1-4194(+)